LHKQNENNTISETENFRKQLKEQTTLKITNHENN